MTLLIRAFLLANLEVDASCLGQRFDIRLGDVPASLLTPRLEPCDQSPRVNGAILVGWMNPRPDSLAELPSDSPIDQTQWGSVCSYDPNGTSHATLSSVLIEMEVDQNALISDGQDQARTIEGAVISDAQEHVHALLERIRDWTGAVADQHTANPRTVRGGLMQNRAWAWNAAGHPDARCNVGDRYELVFRRIEVINRNELAYVIKQACDGNAPPPARLFLASARNAVRQHQFRHAVLDSATSAESVLSGLLDQEFAGLHENIRGRLRSPPLMIRRMVELLKHRALPYGLDVDLNRLRNQVIHQGMSPSQDQAEKAVKLAGELVTNFAFLDPPIE